MTLKFYSFLYQFVILCNQYLFANGKAVIGENVRRAEIDELPFIVSLMRNHPQVSQPELNHICTGSLISLKDVLTAEHCFNGEKINDIHWHADSIDLRAGKNYYIYWLISYNQWGIQKRINLDYEENDIAITRLLENVNRKITPGRITSMSGLDFIGQEVVISGWGVSNTGVSPNIMEMVNVKVITNKHCQTIIEQSTKKSIALDSRIICTIAKPYGLLQNGDSGGPLIFRGTLIAINKSTCPNIGGNDPLLKVNIHLSLDIYKPFITDVKLIY